MMTRTTVIPAAVIAAALVAPVAVAVEGPGPRQMERLGRGVVATPRGDGSVLVSWRLLGTDPEGVAFEVDRRSGDGEAVRIGGGPIAGATNVVDQVADLGGPVTYAVRPVVDGRDAGEGGSFTIGAGASDPFLTIPLRTPEGYRPNDASAGDLDGDGNYEIVLKQEMRPRDNSRAGETGHSLLEAYTLDGALLWRIDLGRNIREGAHYTPFIVYDLDGDGRAEVACKTADGTVDGTGRVLGDPEADHRNDRGYVLDGPESLTIFDGRTGAARATADYVPPRGDVAAWGDDYGNRVDRFLACVAYLDGERPSLVMCRGYYTRAVLAAWDWRDGQLSRRWAFDSDDGTPGHRAYRGQGNHGLSVADVDGDGRDEIMYGACCIDDDGTGLYSTGLGHGDAMHVSDLDPDRPGLEVFGIHERPSHAFGINLRDAASGEVLWGLPAPDVGRGLAMDIDPRHRGAESWASGRGLDALYSCTGEAIGPKPRSCNMGIWWDGDPLRELLDGTTVAKWDYEGGSSRTLLQSRDFGCVSNNGSKSNPSLCADLFGDWREEVVWPTADGRALRVFSTTIPTDVRLVTLMHDPTYRLGIAWQNVGYNQPAHPGFFLGEGMGPPPRPAIRTAGGGER